MDAAESPGAQRDGNSPADEREAVRSSILKFLDSPSHLVHKSLDETLADILSASAPPPNAAAQQPLPEPVSPEQWAVRHSLQTFLNSPKEKVFMTLEETAHALAFPEAAQPVSYAPTYDWEAEIEERVCWRIDSLLNATHADLVREKQRVENALLEYEAVDVSDHASKVRESKERYTRYIQESLEMRELQSQLDDLDSSIKALETTVREAQHESTAKSEKLEKLKSEDALATRLLARMWELDGEERAAQLGIRGELGEKETAELAGLRTGVGTNTDAKEKIRKAAIKKSSSELTDVQHRLKFSTTKLFSQEHAQSKVQRTVLAEKVKNLRMSLIELQKAPGLGDFIVKLDREQEGTRAKTSTKKKSTRRSTGESGTNKSEDDA